MTTQALSQKNLSQKNTTDLADTQPVLRPLVTIVEADAGFTLTAEMPGVPKEEVAVNVENGTLTLQGAIRFPIPDGMGSTYAEVQPTCYKRAFTLSRELDASRIEASQKDGVLTLFIPKAEHAKPRKIEVQVA